VSEPNVEAVYPLSPVQAGILFHSLYEQESRVYFQQLCITYQGPLDVVSYRRAWQRMVDRHAILRTLFVWERQKTPLQVVRRRAELAWSEEDWRERAPAEREEALEAFLRADRERGFDIAKAPPMRMTSIRLADDVHLIVWSFHHLLLDGWSVAVLSREVLACYETFTRGLEPTLPPVSPYRDYIQWLQRQSPTKAEAFWRQYLDGCAAPTRLTTSTGWAGDDGFHEESLELPREMGTALLSFARQHRLTPSTIFQAVWALILGRYLGEEDVLLGAAFSGRPPDLPGIESMVGLFIGTLPVRVRVGGDESFLPWVKRLQEVQVDLQQHQHAALVEIQSWSGVPRGVPMFESLVVFENYPVEQASSRWAPGIEVAGLRYWAHTNYPLHLRVVPGPRFPLSLTYDGRRFDVAGIRGLLQQVRTVVEQVLAQPEHPLRRFSLVTPESRPLLADARASLVEEDFPPVTTLFEGWVRRSPRAPALTHGGRSLNYEELSELAHAVAKALRAGGLESGDVVALEGRPGIGLIAGLLGTLSAGGVALMVDHRLPAARRRLMCREAAAKHLVRFSGEGADEDVWPEADFRSVLPVDLASGVVKPRPELEAEDLREPGPDDGAYVFFTSGTTGVPKGVLGTHRGLSHFVAWQRSEFGVRPGDRSSQLTALSFDVVLREIFLPLTSGATLCLPDEPGELGAERVLPWLEREGITILHTVPTLAQTWLVDPPRGVRLSSIRFVFFAGEPLGGRLVRRWRETFASSARVVNLYGPTETTLAKCFYEVPAEPGEDVQPVGRPLPGSQALVWAEGARPCGVGEWGEIVIRTPYRTRGYVNAPDENRRRFRPNPFRQDERDLIYHTGDRGRFRPDGVLEISGRLDDQIKIRGARVEPDEIAALLGQHEAVRQAAVLGREDAAGEMRLVAYVVAEKGAAPAAEDLRSFLKLKLPEHMVPSAFVFLEALPVTANGKLDRRALPVPEDAASEPAVMSVGPRAPLEEELAAIWREVLGVESLGVHDDFFQLGGHSLRATQVMSRVRSVFQVELPIRSLYEKPTVAALAEALERALGGGAAIAAPIAPLPRDLSLPLSFAQERLWFLDQFTPGGSAYNIAVAVRLEGPLDRGALDRAIREIARRHEVLGARFEMEDGDLVQRVLPAEDLGLRTLDLGEASAEERHAEARRLALEEAERPFDLARGPLFRATLLRLAEAEHVLLVTFHHAVSDAWSLGIFARELETLYGAYREGRAAPLAELPIQYADYARWQRDWLTGEVLDRQLSYWRQRLCGPRPVLAVPTDRPRPAVQTFQGSRKTIVLPKALREELLALGRREGATLFTTLLAAWSALLHRYSGQEDLLVGVPVAGRGRTEIEGLIGLFVNTLVLRTDVSGNPRFRELLARVRQVALEAYAHPDLPFEKLVEDLQPERELSRNPLFQVMFNVYNIPLSPFGLSGIEASLLPVGGERSRFDLNLSMLETSEGLVAGLEYNTDLFEGETVERMLRHFERVLEEVVARPDVRVSDVSLLTEAERREVVEGWNATKAEYPRDAAVQQLFEAQAARRPEAIAVSYRGRDLSYGELNRRANQLAWHLKGLGVGPEVRVGVCVERSLEMVVGLLGILKAGGAYVPLDPSQPRERLAFMLEDSGVGVVLTQKGLLPGLPPLRARALRLDADWDAVARESAADLAVPVGEDNLAYVIYTSGSTGTPKGVEVEHRGLRNLVGWHQRVYGVTESDRATQLANLSFDASVWEIWPYLAAGASVHLLPDDDLRLSPAALLEWMAASRISVSFLPTPLAEAVLREVASVAPAGFGLRALLTGGDTLHAHPPDGLPFALFNHYGPTEASVVSTWTEVGTRERPEGAAPPIGRPIDNTQAYVLDERMRLVPVGVPGELYVGGASLARGYLGRPDLTAGLFVPDPLGKEPGGRLYRTGDRVRWRADGQIEFLGRRDHQVKVRGSRIEPGEIESVLGRHPGVGEAVVVVREDEGSGKRLVAYVSAKEGRSVTGGELRSHLRGELPEYMVPSAFVVLVSLPLNANGKVDRQALPEPGRDEGEVSGRVRPRTELEGAIAGVWREALGVEEVGVEENFFDLGGHSLLLARVQHRLREVLPREVSIVELFQYPTISALARHVSGEDAASPLAGVRERVEKQRRGTGGDGAVAIIGMTGRFPGAESVEEFWRNLCEGVESITFFSDEELLAAGVDPRVVSRPEYVKARGVLKDVELFDAAFFGYSPREAAVIDPQQRLFLECAYESLEAAGYDAERYEGRIGVFSGVSANSYLGSFSDPGVVRSLDAFQAAIGSDKDFLPTRVSYKLNLRGPSVAIQTACSTSLVAVHMACRSLLGHECDMALAGGVRVLVPQAGGYLYQEGGIASPDGHCRAFDAKAGGTVAGSGVGVVVLKRLADAVSDGDPILAVIRGSAINNDGSAKAGYTAPSVTGQAEVIATAQALAGTPPGTIQYVEAHGTGTAVGDPIEMAALTQAFRAGTSAVGYCAIGSVKTNVGHLDVAAGVTGLIKATLALRHGRIPASLHYESPNPKMDLSGSPFYVNASTREWKGNGTARRAGVSSFGIGGTNAHVVLEEAPAVEAGTAGPAWKLVLLSARTQTALVSATQRLARHLGEHPELDLADVAYTLQVGRKRFRERRALVCRDAVEAIEALEGKDPGRLLSGEREDGEASVAFLFPGQGTQQVDVGLELYRSGGRFREEVDRCCRRLERELGLDLRTVLYPGVGEAEAATRRLGQTALTQPALFVLEYALARQWMEWGVRPQSMLGHSIGEYVAGCLAGVFSIEDALGLVAARGRMVQELPPGAMLAVPLGEEEIGPWLGEEIDLAAVNGSGLCVVGGSPEAIEELERRLSGAGVEARRLRTSHAFHTRAMDPVVGAYRERVARVKLNPPRIPFVSNVTGRWITAEQATDPGYWAGHLRRPVRFADGLRELGGEPRRVLLEVGPGQTLSALARHSGEGARSVSSLGGHSERRPADAAVLEALARLWLTGVEPDWARVHEGERRLRVALPTYPFERQRCWLDAGGSVGKRPTAGVERAPIDEWFYVPSWTRSIPPPAPVLAEAVSAGSCWLCFVDEAGLGAELLPRLARPGRDVVSVRTGAGFVRLGEDTYSIRPGRPGDYEALLQELASRGLTPTRIVHLWGVGEPPASDTDGLDAEQDLGFYSLLFLGQALARHGGTLARRLIAVTSGVHEVVGGERVRAGKATVLAPCKVIPLESPAIECRAVDVDLPPGGAWPAALLDALAAEVEHPSRDRVIAYRKAWRWVQAFQRVEAPRSLRRLRPRGVYLVTGGLGGVGLEIAELLAETVQARLVLTGRSPFPGREGWDRWLEEHRPDDPTRRRIERIRSLEQKGAEVLVAQADVTDPVAMRALVARVGEELGDLHGVFHAAGEEKAVAALLEVERAQCEREFEPKIRGLLALEEALAGSPVDFCFVQSSLAAVLGAAGYVAYVAAHLFMDAFVEARRGRSPVAWITADWDNWTTGNAGAAEEGAGLRMTAREGREAVARVLSLEAASHVVVSSVDLQARAERPANLAQAAEAAALPAGAASSPRPDLRTAYVAARTERERTLVVIWEALLGLAPVGIHDNFFELGGDSVVSIQLVARARAAGLKLSARQAFEHQTVAEQAAAARQAGEAERAEPAASTTAGPVALTPIQRWFFEQDFADPHHFNQGVLLELPPGTDANVAERAWHHVAAHHEALRTLFHGGADGWQARPLEAEPPPFRRVQLARGDGAAVEAAVAELQGSLDFGRGPIALAAILDRGPARPSLLLLSVHHLVVDVQSWRVLLEDLATAWRQIASGSAVRLPPPTTSFAEWAHRLEAHARSADVARKAEHWLAQPWHRCVKLQAGVAGTGTFGSARSVNVSLSPEETHALLHEVPAKHRVQVHEVLLASVARAVVGWTGSTTLLVDVEGHGREAFQEDIDLSRTVGWFTTLVPVLLDLEGARDAASVVKSVKEQLRRMPDRGFPFGLSRYLRDDDTAERLRRLPRAEVSFLYVGRPEGPGHGGAPFGAFHSPGPQRSPRAHRPYVLEVQAGVASGRLDLSLVYSESLHDRSTMEELAGAVLAAVREALIRLGSDSTAVRTPSDFPAARLGQRDLDHLLSTAGRPRRRPTP
jgi:amino acid adenylation domain-containing protein/non-ribosomal peptide synthase protein (TIGR01720 family)